MARPTHRLHCIQALLSMVVACLLLLSVPRTTAMMDMPDDPVNGKMVMSAAFNFQLQNGQRLRFASAETLQQFEKDPLTGLGEVVLADKASAQGESTLCPVCGMENAASGGPQVLMQHGDQVIHTCSMFHAHQVHDQILTLRDAAAATATAPAKDDEPAPFCTGSGTSMLNGFTFFQSGRVSSACVLLWFPGWVLNTPWRYLLGCLTVVLCAMFNEYLLKLRRVLRKESNAKRILVEAADGSTGEAASLLRPRAYSASYVAPSPASSTGIIAKWFRGLSGDTQHMVHCLLHGGTIMLAYMLMLVSMTYDGVLFLCCIVGYIVGYFVFGERRDAVLDEDALGFGSA